MYEQIAFVSRAVHFRRALSLSLALSPSLPALIAAKDLFSLCTAAPTVSLLEFSYCLRVAKFIPLRKPRRIGHVRQDKIA